MSQKGQALIEALVAGFICCGAFLLLLKCGLGVFSSAWTDEVLEDHLLCRAAQSADCDRVLATRLKLAGIRRFSLTSSSTENTLTDRLETETPFSIQKKEKDLPLDFTK